MNLLDMLFKGGFFMWPILLLSVVALAVAIERFFVLRKARLDVGQFMMKLRSIYRRGDANAVLAFCSQKDAPIANIIRRGITKHGESDEKIREAVENAGREEVFHLERRLSVLASVGGFAPMLGFLGTVTGMISAFQAIEYHGGVVNPTNLAGGIWEALLTTAFGLIVGIPALAFYNYFVTKVGQFVHQMEVTSTEFLEMLDGKGSALPAGGTQEEGGAPLAAAGLQGDEFFRKKG